MISAGRLDDASRVLADAIRRYPRSGDLYNLLGIIAAEQNKPAAAKAAFLQAIERSPALVPALLNLARIYYAERSPDAAIETYVRALKVDGQLEEAHANLSALFLDQGKYAAALLNLAALPPALAEQDRFRALRCAALAGSGKLSQATQAADRISGAATEADVSLAAFVLAKLHRDALVVNMLDPVVRKGCSKELRGLLASACAQTGDLARAFTLFESIAAEDPRSIQPLEDAARVAYRRKDYETAAAYLLRALKIEPGNAELRFFQGIVCIDLNLPGDALQSLEEAVRLNPGNAAYNYALGVAALAGGQADSAVTHFERYLALRPADPHGRLALGTAEFEASNFDRARRELSPLLANPATAPGAHYVLGKICRREANFEAAAAHFSAALKLEPQNALLSAQLADVLLRENKFTDARRALDKALALDPDNYLANESLLLLLRKQKDPGASQQAERFAALTRKASDDRALLLRHIQLEP